MKSIHRISLLVYARTYIIPEQRMDSLENNGPPAHV